MYTRGVKGPNVTHCLTCAIACNIMTSRYSSSRFLV